MKNLIRIFLIVVIVGAGIRASAVRVRTKMIARWRDAP